MYVCICVVYVYCKLGNLLKMFSVKKFDTKSAISHSEYTVKSG